MGFVYFLVGVVVFIWLLKRLFSGIFSGLKKKDSLSRSIGIGLLFALLSRFIPALNLLSLISFLAPFIKREENHSASANASPPPNGLMSKEEARQILGVDPNATKADVQEAYKRLMLRNHPDGGGTDYLASKINQARDVLLKG
jgi:hypothetical protein